MKRFIATFIVWMWSVASVAFAAADEEAAVRAVMQEVFAAAKSGNGAVLATYFLPDHSTFFLGSNLITRGLSHQGLKAVYGAGYRPNLHVNRLDVTVYDNTALATGYMGGTISFPGESVQPVTLEGPWRLFIVLRKQGGSWKIAHIHDSPLTPPLPQPVAVRFPDAMVNGFYQPEGSGPFPAVVLLHGCSGVEEQQALWAKTLQEWGYVILIVDSFGPRGIEQICTDPGFLVTVAQRTLDAYAALRYLQNQSFVDPKRVGVMGWSHGGLTVLDVIQEAGLQTALDLPQGGFRAAVAWYPYCPPKGVFTTPLLILTGEKDDWTLAVPCVEMVAAVHGHAAPVILKVYPEATHGFDIPSPYGTSTYRGHTLAYNAQATEAARGDLKRFLDQHFKGTVPSNQAARK